jgi:hypothetical protein
LVTSSIFGEAIMLRSKLTLGAALIGAGLLAGCAYEPVPGPYAYNPGYYAYDPAYYGYGYAYDPYYYGAGYSYGPGFYGYYDAGHHWHDGNRADGRRDHGNRPNNVNMGPRGGGNVSHGAPRAPTQLSPRSAHDDHDRRNP